MTTTMHMHAHEHANAYNAKIGVALLRVDSSVMPVFSLEQLADVEKLHGWVTTREVFEHVFKRKATAGELINLGRQLTNCYPRRRLGRTSLYFVTVARKNAAITL